MRWLGCVVVLELGEDAAPAIPAAAPAVASVPAPIECDQCLSSRRSCCQNLLRLLIDYVSDASRAQLSAHRSAVWAQRPGILLGVVSRATVAVRRLCEHMFVRWSNLTIEGEEQRPLPGYRDEAVVRRFDAPEALETRFYEVQARSVLNRVPERSRMPFRWTINPYRGCSHACVYCFARPTHSYLGFDAGRDFEREIVVKVNAPEVLRAELARPLVERRARGAWHEHRPLSVGRGALPADGGHLGGAARRRQPVLGADEVAAAAARPGADARDRAAHEHHARACRSRRSTRRRGGPPSRTRRTRGRGWRRSPSSTAPGSRRAC